MEDLYSEVKEIRGVKLIKKLHGQIPLSKIYWPLLSACNPKSGLLSIPFDRNQLLVPAVWKKQALIFSLFGPKVIPEFKLVSPILRNLDDGVIVDVGANIGIYELLIRSISDLPIIAYEPQPFLNNLLEWNMEFNKFSGVTVRNMAIGQEAGEIPFITGINGAVLPEAVAQDSNKKASSKFKNEMNLAEKARYQKEGGDIVNVPVVKLDDDIDLQTKVSYLKIDVEGFEQNVLFGAQKIIEKHRPHILLELHPSEIPKHGGSVKAIIEFLEAYYNLEFWRFSHSDQEPRLWREKNNTDIDGYKYSNSRELMERSLNPIRLTQDYIVCKPK